MPEVDFRHCPAQTYAYEKWQEGHRLALAWGRGTGKSWFGRTCLYLLVAQNMWRQRETPKGPLHGIRANLLYPTFKHFTRLGHAQAIRDELGKDGKWGFLGARIKETDWRISFPGGSYIQLLTAEASNRGARTDVALIDECDEVDLGYYESVIGPWFTEPWSLNMQILSGTPMRGRYGLLYHAYKKYPESDPNSFGFHATAYDASEAIFSRSELERARATVAPVRFETEYLCNFDAGEGLVFPHFREDFHVRYPHPETTWREFIVGVDWGYEDPTVFLAIGVAGHGKDTQLHLLGEWVMQHRTDSELIEVARQVDEMCPGARWYADPSQPKSIDTLGRSVDIGQDGYNRGGAGVMIVKGDNAILDGVATVADTLTIRERPEPLGHWAQLFIHPDCKHTIQEFGMYRRKKDGRSSGSFSDDIEDRNNHCMDALRYAIHTHFAGADRRIKTGY